MGNNPEKEGNLIDLYRRCKKENDTLVERLSNIEKDKSLMNKKVEKQKKKIQKLKRKLVKEQVKCKNLDCQIEELQHQNSELEIEVNSQRAWSKAISKVDRKYSKNENINNKNKSKEIHLKGENPTLLSKTCAVKETPSKHQKPSAAADSYRISGIVPIASSTPTLNRSNTALVLGFNSKSQSWETHKDEGLKEHHPLSEGQTGQRNDKEMLVARSLYRTEDKNVASVRTHHNNGELMNEFRTKMQAAETRWETEIKWEVPKYDEVQKGEKIECPSVEQEPTSIKKDKNKNVENTSSIDTGSTSMESTQLCDKEISSSAKAANVENSKRKNKTNEFKILNALKANDPIINAA